MSSHIDKYNSSIISLWEERMWEILSKDERISRLCPMLIPYENTNKPIIVLGINPSHSERDFRGEKAVNKQILEWNLRDEINSKTEKIISIQKDAHINVNYFKSIKKFFKNQVKFSDELFFLDLFPIRHTEQKELIAFLKDYSEIKKIFIDNFYYLLKNLNPKAIVVLNKKASEYLKKEFKANIRFDEGIISKGQFILKNVNVPIIFSGMITVGLDVYSKERLALQLLDSISP